MSKLGAPCAVAGLSRWLSGKESACQRGRRGFDPWVGKTPGEGNGNSLQYSCLDYSMEAGGWGTTVRGIAESDMTYPPNNSNNMTSVVC